MRQSEASTERGEKQAKKSKNKDEPKLEGICRRDSDMNEGKSLIIVPSVVSAPPINTVCRSPVFLCVELDDVVLFCFVWLCRPRFIAWERTLPSVPNCLSRGTIWAGVVLRLRKPSSGPKLSRRTSWSADRRKRPRRRKPRS